MRRTSRIKPRATKPDHWESVTRIKLPRGSKAYKPADSGAPVGNDARRCSFHRVTLTAVNQSMFNDPKTCGSELARYSGLTFSIDVDWYGPIASKLAPTVDRISGLARTSGQLSNGSPRPVFLCLPDKALNTAYPLWERACSRWRSYIQHRC